MTPRNQTVTGLIFGLILAIAGRAQTPPQEPARQSPDVQPLNSPQPFVWESPARLRHSLFGGTPGTLRIDSVSVEFVPLKGSTRRWAFTEIKDLDVQGHRLVVIGYDNRGWHRPGTQQFDLRLKKDLTPAVAASLAAEMRRPIRDRVPDPDAQAITVIPVRRSDHFVGSNGFLRIRQQGIDYVTAKPGQSRSWRWLDLQTLSNPDPYHLFVFGYRDNYSFDLKETLSRDLFNHLSDEIWTHNESEMKSSSMPLSPSKTMYGGRKGE